MGSQRADVRLVYRHSVGPPMGYRSRMWWFVAMVAASGLDDARRLEREGRLAAALTESTQCAVTDARCASLRDRLLARQDPDGTFDGWSELQAVRASVRVDGSQVAMRWRGSSTGICRR